jgi:histidinol-phosphate/aromatic aminotransferase/cobyric acid decarboxylase-like protein
VVRRELEGLDFVEKVYPSDANFLLFRVKQRANELYKTVSCALKYMCCANCQNL